MRIRNPMAAAAVLAVILGAAPISVSVAGAHSAAASYQPDGQIRLLKTTSEYFGADSYDTPWKGDNTYNATAYRQTVRETWCCETPGWQGWIFGVSIQNDGANNDQVRVQATGNALEGWTVKYFHGPTNISAAVVSGTFVTPSLAPGADYVIKVKVHRDGDIYDTDNLRRLISLTSVGGQGRSDTVKLVTRRVACTC